MGDQARSTTGCTAAAMAGAVHEDPRQHVPCITAAWTCALSTQCCVVLDIARACAAPWPCVGSVGIAWSEATDSNSIARTISPERMRRNSADDEAVIRSLIAGRGVDCIDPSQSTLMHVCVCQRGARKIDPFRSPPTCREVRRGSACPGGNALPAPSPHFSIAATKPSAGRPALIAVTRALTASSQTSFSTFPLMPASATISA